MIKIALLVGLIFVTMLGCTKTQTIDMDDRARLVAEEINSSPVCSKLKTKLIHDVHDQQSLQDTYQEAQKTHCLNGDI